MQFPLSIPGLSHCQIRLGSISNKPSDLPCSAARSCLPPNLHPWSAGQRVRKCRCPDKDVDDFCPFQYKFGFCVTEGKVHGR